jgi:hypothetical protein
MIHHRGIHSQKYVVERRKRRQIFLFLGVLCVLTLTASGILLLRAPFFQIKKVVVDGGAYSSKEGIEKIVLESLSGSYFNIIPHSNIFFYSKHSIEKAINENFKEINKFKIHRSGFDGLQIVLDEKNPAAVVCSGFRDETSDNDCYWTDEHGFVFGPTASSSSPAGLTSYGHYYVSTEDTPLKPGTYFVPEKRFKELQNFMDGAAKGGLLPLGVLISDGGEYEMYIKNKKSDSEVTVYFDDTSPFDKTLENLLTFWTNSEQTKKATTTPAFDYINLRFGNTVYYSTQ